MFGVKGEGEGSRGVTCQSHGNDALVRNFHLYQAQGAEVAATLAVAEERDALAPMVILACLLARRKVGDFARRLAPVDLARTGVAFGIPEIYPLTICGMNRVRIRGINKRCIHSVEVIIVSMIMTAHGWGEG